MRIADDGKVSIGERNVYASGLTIEKSGNHLFLGYLISGLPVLATKTFANEEIIKPTAGILINDDPESVALGIEEFDFRKKEFDRVQIQADYQEYTWKNLVNQKLKPIIKHFI